jgi:hypothetical protein
VRRPPWSDLRAPWPECHAAARDQLVGGSGALVVGTHHHERRYLDAVDRLDRRGDDRIQHVQQRDRIFATRPEPLLGALLRRTSPPPG